MKVFYILRFLTLYNLNADRDNSMINTIYIIISFL